MGGSRNEEHSNSGIGHALRIAAGLGTKNNSSFGICRNLQQAGASLTCVQGREHTLYTIQATRDSTDLAADYLCDVVSNQAFKPWELERNLPRMKLELATKNPAADAVELLHQAAFRSGLGNSLYCAPHKVGSHSTAQLQTFVSKHFTSGRSALLGIGVNHANLAKFGELLNLEAGSGPADVASKYSGGQGKLAKAAAAASSGNQSVSAIGQMYSDAGLLGAMVVCEASSAGKVVGAVAAALRSAQVTDEEVAAAKKNMLADVYTMLEAPLNQIENMGSQVLMSGEVMPAEKVPELIAGITTADVQAAAKKLSSAKLSMGACGNLSTVPFLDSL